MIQNFFELDLTDRRIEVENGGTLSLGYHQLTFVFCPDGTLAGSYGNL